MFHPECPCICRIDKTHSDLTGKALVLHKQRRQAIVKAKEGRSCFMTSSTGSGTSCTYISPIADHTLRQESGRGIQAIVYRM